MHRLAPSDSAPLPPLRFSGQSRLMLIAPHPDDESLACAIALQAAARAGAAIRVVYATDGDNNPWPQRFIERKWRISQADRLRWGKLRQQEAQAALVTLGLRAEDACFLGWPDQGLTDLLMRDQASMLSTFRGLIDDFGPTDIVFPSTADAHPDHNALAVLLLLILRQLPAETAPESAWQFAVHGNNPAFFANAHPMGATPSEKATKVKAIACHQTQLKLSRRRFLRYAEKPEQFLSLQSATLPAPQAAPQIIARAARQLTVYLPPRKNVFTRELRLLAIGHSDRGEPNSAIIRFSKKSTVAEMVDGRTRMRGPALILEGNHLIGLTITIPIGGIFSPDHPIFVKLSRRSLAFADAGWSEAPTCAALIAPTQPSDREPALQNA